MLDTQDLLRTDIIDIINYYKIQQSESKSIHQWLIYLVHIFSNHVNLFTFLDIFICQCAGPYLSKDIGQWFESFSIRISGLYLQKYMDQQTGIVQDQVFISRYIQKPEDYISCSCNIFPKIQELKISDHWTWPISFERNGSENHYCFRAQVQISDIHTDINHWSAKLMSSNFGRYLPKLKNS